MSDSLDTDFVVNALQRALETAKPGIINSDQGSQYTSAGYVEAVLAAGVRLSMDGRGRAIDNVFTERFWRSLKYEEVYLNDYYTPREARQGVDRYVNFTTTSGRINRWGTGRRQKCTAPTYARRYHRRLSTGHHRKGATVA